jgi:DNA-binding transcriptional LysR family regulator
MDISDLHYFTAAADAGSFFSAGKALGRDPSTLSRRIGGLEDELGLPLFERRHGGVLLTSGGKAALGHVRRALAEINLIKAAALKNGAATVGEVCGSSNRAVLHR